MQPYCHHASAHKYAMIPSNDDCRSNPDHHLQHMACCLHQSEYNHPIVEAIVRPNEITEKCSADCQHEMWRHHYIEPIPPQAHVVPKQAIQMLRLMNIRLFHNLNDFYQIC